MDRKTAALLACAAVLSVSAPGCHEFDTTPVEVEHGTLGEEIVQVFCERMAREANPTDASGARWKPVCSGAEAPPADAPPRLVALMQNRDRLAGALDATLPEGLHDDLGLFLGELLPFFDEPEERLPTSTRRLAEFLDRLSRDDDALAAMERIGARQGYRPLRYALGVARPALAYPELDDFTGVAIETLLDGPAREPFLDLLRALALEMATLEPSADEPGPSTLELTRRLMFSESDAFQAGDPTWVVRRDLRGVALPDDQGGGVVPSPFADVNGDGLADIDARGRFIDASGSLLDVPSPFRLRAESGVPRDDAGRALRADTTRYYGYFDANRTMLGGVTAEIAPWLDPASPSLMQMSRGLPVLLGPEVMLSEGYGSFDLLYTGFNTQDGPMLDAVAAMGELIYRDSTQDALTVTEALLRDHESDTAGLIRAAREMAIRGDSYPNAQLTENSILWDDLIALIVRIAGEPGMLEAILRSFSDERSASLGTVYGAFMRNRDRVTYDPGAWNSPPVGLPLDDAVDHGTPDTFDNESLFQRTLGLIDGLNGVQVCNRDGAVLNIRVELGPLSVPLRWPLFGTAGECEIIRIDNVAEAYARSILGTYELELQSGFLSALVTVAGALGVDVDGALEATFQIDGLTQMPTPQALNRLVFWGLSDDSGMRSCIPDDNGGNCNSPAAGQIFTPVIDRHGNDVIARYHGTIFAWESPGFYEGMTPLLQVLHTPGYTYDFEGNYYFGDLLGTLHQHWGSTGSTETCGPGMCAPGDPNFSYQSNARSYEPLLADGFADAELVARLQRVNVALETIEVRPGVDGVAALAVAAEDMIDPANNPGFIDRRGQSMATVNDGSRQVPMTPLYMLLDALAAMDTAWEAEPERRLEFLAARRAIADQMLATDTLGADFRMGNPRFRAMLLEILPFLRERVDFHRGQGDLLEWSTGLDERLGDQMREPLMAALVRFLDAVNEDPEARRALSQLMAYLLTVAEESDGFETMLYALAEGLMLLEDDENIIPLMRAMSGGMAPNVDEAIAGTEAGVDVEGSAVYDALDLLRDIQEIDDGRVLRQILQSAVALPASGDEITPLETIVDVIAEVNRATPNEGTPLLAPDYREVIGQAIDFVRDEDHGLERLNAVVQERSCFPERGLTCPEAGVERESAGSCYVGATCVCSEQGGELRWDCAAP